MRKSDVSRKQFIRMGAALGAGSAGTVMLAGCGNPGTASLPAKTGDEDVPAGVSPGGTIAAEGEVQPNSAVDFVKAENGEPAVLVRLPSEEFVAYSAMCTHQGCIVAYQPQMKKLACPCHGGVFDPAQNAAVVSGPPARPLPAVKFEVRDAEILLA